MRKTSCNGICCSNKSLLLKVSGSLSLSGKLNSWTPGRFLTSHCMVSHRHFHGFCLLNISMRCVWIKELPEQIIKCSILFLTTVLDVHECKNWWMWMDQSSDTSFKFSVFCGLGTQFWSIHAKTFPLGALDGALFCECSRLLFEPF